jgi:thermitase
VIRTALARATSTDTVRATEQASKQTLGKPSVRIAIVDTGVTPLLALAANIKGGYDLVDGTPARDDGNGHGTAMASIAAARPGNRTGMTGVCSLCTIVPVQVVGNGGFGTTALATAGIRWAIADRVNVINVSLTSPTDDPSLDAAIEDAAAQGIVVVLAAGNDASTDPSTGGYPAAATPDAISVAGADASGHLFPWSNHGPWVQIAAPGALPALTLKGRVFSAAGTSASAAFVSGAVGLVLSANPLLTPAQVQSILLTTGTPVPGLDVQSGRMIDVQAAVAAAAAAAAA